VLNTLFMNFEQLHGKLTRLRQVYGWNRSIWTIVLLFLVAACVQLSAQQSFEEIKVKAEKGDSLAQFDLGCYYYHGEGVTKDAVEAVKWFRKAADQGLAQAQYNLGLCYALGEGVTKDSVQAVNWWGKAAEWGYAAAQCNLGLCYAVGEGVTKDSVQATKWWGKAAEKGEVKAQYWLGCNYYKGEGVTKDAVEAVKWFRKAADQREAKAEERLAHCYHEGEGVTKDAVEAVKWFHKAADQGLPDGAGDLGFSYLYGDGVTKDVVEAVKWLHKAADQGNAKAQFFLGACYLYGEGVPKDYVEAYEWVNLASAHQSPDDDPRLGGSVKKMLSNIESMMTPEQIAEAQRLSREFKPRQAPESGASFSEKNFADSGPAASGTGFFITRDGFLITNQHVVDKATQVRLVTRAGIITAKVVKEDAANDLALLKADGQFALLPVNASRSVRLGSTVATVGFPNIGLQGFAPKLAKGEIAALSGAQDDPRYFQISVPVQPGNSGGALVDERGNVVGVVSAKLSARAALDTSGALPENVNYAVKSSFLLSFLESVPEVSAKLKEASSKECRFEDVVKSAEQAAVLVLVY
jgi:TPR repeat protein